MINLTDYLDRLSIIKVLSFFLLIMLIFTLIPMILDFNFGNLIFKLVLYGIMLVFFIYKFHKVDLKEFKLKEFSFLDAFKNDFNSLFKICKFHHILFIVAANILFVSTVYFFLTYLDDLSMIKFTAPLFGNFSGSGIDVIFIYFLSVVILSPIIEELIFRGIFLRRFDKALNDLTLAILVSSVLFGICHSFGGILGAILFGICVSILFVKSGNILVPIFAHFLNNIISFLLALSGIESFILGNSIFVILIIILAIVSNFVLLRAIIKEWPRSFKVSE